MLTSFSSGVGKKSYFVPFRKPIYQAKNKVSGDRKKFSEGRTFHNKVIILFCSLYLIYLSMSPVKFSLHFHCWSLTFRVSRFLSLRKMKKERRKLSKIIPDCPIVVQICLILFQKFRDQMGKAGPSSNFGGNQ